MLDVKWASMVVMSVLAGVGVGCVIGLLVAFWDD